MYDTESRADNQRELDSRFRGNDGTRDNGNNTVTIEPKALLKEIISDVEGLKVKLDNKEDKEKVLTLLNKLQSEQDTLKPQAVAEAILKAIDELMEIKSADITQQIIQIRLNLDVELKILAMGVTTDKK